MGSYSLPASLLHLYEITVVAGWWHAVWWSREICSCKALLGSCGCRGMRPCMCLSSASTAHGSTISPVARPATSASTSRDTTIFPGTNCCPWSSKQCWAWLQVLSQIQVQMLGHFVLYSLHLSNHIEITTVIFVCLVQKPNTALTHSISKIKIAPS